MKKFQRKLRLLGSIILFLQITCFNTSAQINLINDPSFEDTICTPDFCNLSNQYNFLKYWKALDSIKPWKCNFVIVTMNGIGYGLPQNQWCFQFPKNGITSMYMGFIFVPDNFNKRSLCRSKLKSKLILGQTYCAKMYVNPTERYSRYTQDGIAMYFDNGQLDTICAMDSSGVYTFVQPQVSNPQGNIIMDTVGWTLVSGTFVANGTEEFITIGNFKSDANTDTAVILPSSTALGCELLIEDVSLYPVNASNWLPDAYGTIGDSTIIGLPNFEVPDGMWFTYNMVPIDTASQIKVKNTQAITQYIQAIDVCNSVIYDTMTVYAYPLDLPNPSKGGALLSIYPNPAKNIITIFNIATNKIIITDVQGKIMKEIAVKNNSVDIDVAFLPKGVYLVKDGWRVARFVKE
jgi:hypothetical protein